MYIMVTTKPAKRKGKRYRVWVGLEGGEVDFPVYVSVGGVVYRICATFKTRAGAERVYEEVRRTELIVFDQPKPRRKAK
jgi:hypothetical protein